MVKCPVIWKSTPLSSATGQRIPRARIHSVKPSPAHAWCIIHCAEKAKSDTLNQIVVTMSKDGQKVYEGAATDSLGDQWKALRWLINSRLRHGWKIEPGQVLITGALGQVLDGTPGVYRADYGKLGVIEFVIR